MTPLKTECISTQTPPSLKNDETSFPKQDPIQKFGRSKSSKRRRKTKILDFGRLNQRAVIADFEGGHISSDGGLILIKQLDEHYGVSAQIAGCFTDNRHPSYVEHPIQMQVAQRLYGLVQGYEDLNDHEQLRHDPMLGIAVGKLESDHARCAPLAGKSTLNRLEKSYRQDSSEAVDKRYVKTEVDPFKLEQVLLDIFIAKRSPPPQISILDMDVTDDATYGNQEKSAFNPYYHGECYAPLYIFCGRDLLATRLRPSNVDPAYGALEELKRIIPHLRQQWPETLIIVRGDSAYARDDIMSWCESMPKVEYVLALSSNSRLQTRAQRVENYAQQDYQHRREQVKAGITPHLQANELSPEDLDQLIPPAVSYGCFPYKTLDTWQIQRRVVCKVTYGASGPRRHFVVTSFSSQQFSSKALHIEQYCPRGEMENRLKEQQLDLFSDRTSNHYFDDNQLRLWFSSFAYVLLNLLREELLHHTKLANARVGTIRDQLLKVGTLIRISVRRIYLAMHSSFPNQDLFNLAYQRLAAMADSSG